MIHCHFNLKRTTRPRIQDTENQLWLVIQVLQESLVSPCAELVRDRGCQGRKEKQLYRSHKILFCWWLAD